MAQLLIFMCELFFSLYSFVVIFVFKDIKTVSQMCSSVLLQRLVQSLCVGNTKNGLYYWLNNCLIDRKVVWMIAGLMFWCIVHIIDQYVPTFWWEFSFCTSIRCLPGIGTLGLHLGNGCHGWSPRHTWGIGVELDH